MNVGHILLKLLIGKSLTLGGERLVKGSVFSKDKKMYFSQMSFLFFDEGLYERLTIMDHFKFYKDINESNQSIDQILKLTHLETKKKIKIRNLSSSEKRRVLDRKSVV